MNERKIDKLGKIVGTEPSSSIAATRAVFHYKVGTPEYVKACRDYRREMYLYFARDLGRRAGGQVYRAIMDGSY